METKKIAKKILEKKKKTWEHTKRVVKLCRKFTEQLDTDINVEILYEAAWLHDTGKTTEYKKKYHHKAEAVRQALARHEHDLTSDMDVLTGVIQAHKEEFDPPEGYELESAVLRICDKLDKYQQAKCAEEEGDMEEAFEKSQEAAKKCNKSMMKIKDKLAPDIWDAFEDAYAKMLALML